MRHFLSLTGYHFVCFACSIGVYDGSQIYAVRHGCMQSLAINTEVLRFFDGPRTVADSFYCFERVI